MQDVTETSEEVLTLGFAAVTGTLLFALFADQLGRHHVIPGRGPSDSASLTPELRPGGRRRARVWPSGSAFPGEEPGRRSPSSRWPDPPGPRLLARAGDTPWPRRRGRRAPGPGHAAGGAWLGLGAGDAGRQGLAEGADGAGDLLQQPAERLDAPGRARGRR